MKKKVLVTGGAGYVGSHTCRLLIEKGYDVVILDNLSTGHKWALAKKAKFYKIDLSDKKEILKLFDKNKFDFVIHFAGSIEAGESMKDPAKYFRNNTVNTMNLLDVMIEKNAKKIIFSSTAAVYGEPQYVPMDENHPANPTNYYGASKLFIEKILESYHNAYGLNYVALRYFNACGADDSGKIGEMHSPETHLIPIVLEAAKKGRAVSVFGNDYKTKDGTCVRDYIHVSDLAIAHVLSMEKIDKLKNQCINLGSGKGNTVFEIVDICRKVTGKKIKTKIAKRRKGDPAVLISDYKKARKLLLWTPRRDVFDIINSAWKWHKHL